MPMERLEEDFCLSDLADPKFVGWLSVAPAFGPKNGRSALQTKIHFFQWQLSRFASGLQHMHVGCRFNRAYEPVGGTKNVVM